MSDEPAGQPTPQGGADVLTGLHRLIERQSGDASRVAELLYRENHDLREKNRTLTARVPGEGAAVLTPEQAAHWQAYQSLGAPDALTTAIQERQQAIQELAGLRRAETLRSVAEVAGVKASVLGQLPGVADLVFAIRDVTVDGKTTKMAYVCPQGGTEVSLGDYAQQHWADFLPALKPEVQQPQGTPFVPQSPAGQGASSPVDDFITRSNAQRASKANPLTKK